VLLLIDLLVDVSSALGSHKCDSHILKTMTLPCGRDLWKATTDVNWSIEIRETISEKQLTYGDLLHSRFRTDHTLDSWLSELDEFGTLVMAAASIPE